MSSVRGIAPVCAAALAVLLLVAGCAAGATSPGAGSTSGAATGSPTPTPALSAPRSALPIECAQLLPLEQLQPFLGVPVSVQIDETHLPRLLAELSLLQAGGTECAWGGVNMTDATWDTGVELAILPDAGQDFATWEADPEAPTSVTGTVGDSSGLTCSPDSGWCNGDALVGNYWVSFSVNDASTPDASAATAKADQVMAIVVAAIRGSAPARTNWTPPAATITGSELCTDSATATVASLLSSAATLAPIEPGYGITAVAASRTHLAACTWSNSAGALTIETLPVGSWAMPALTANPPFWTLLGHPTTLDVSGSDGALSACGDGCQAYVSLERSLVTVYQSTNGDPSIGFGGVVDKVVAAIRAR